jgi:hypothetical protein
MIEMHTFTIKREGRMKKTILVLMAALVLIAAPLYAGNGDLIVSGKLGVGTTSSPGYTLDLAGGTFGFGDGNSRTEFKNDAGAIGGQSGFFQTSQPLNYPYGASSWWHLLDVRHSTSSNNYSMQIAGSFFDQNLYYRKTNNNPATGWSKFVVQDPSGNVGIGISDTAGAKLYVNGLLFVAGPTFSTGGYYVSDIKYKKNFQSVDSSLDKILNLNGVSYEWKIDEYKGMGFPEGRHYGVVAQEIEKVLPEAVNTSPDGSKAVAYAEIIPVLIEAIKEQQKQIEELKKLVKASQQ